MYSQLKVADLLNGAIKKDVSKFACYSFFRDPLCNLFLSGKWYIGKW